MNNIFDGVVIDAGHGGVDSGARGNNALEKDYTLLISKYMYDRFNELGIPVYLTRDSDVTLDPSDRVDKILSFFGNDPDVVVISNHLNAGGGDGAEVIYALRNSSSLADMVLKNIGNTGQNTRRIYQRRLPSDSRKDYYFIHRNTGNTEPLIIEYGFIDNDDDLRFIKDNYKELAEAVVKAVLEYKNIPYEEPDKVIKDTYKVMKGDTLYGISKKLDTTVDELKKINNLTSNSLSIGQLLKIPTKNIDLGDTEIYQIKKGDTLYSIANKYGISLNELKAINNLENDNLAIGQLINVPSGLSVANTYVVTKGDTLYSIAKKFNISIDKLKELNNLTDNMLSIGQKLIIPFEEDMTYVVKAGDTIFMGNNIFYNKKYGIIELEGDTMFGFLNNKTRNNKIEEKERIKGSLFGFFVGDALGVPIEFINRDELKKNKVTKMLEYGTHNQPIGTWSDDSSMVIATMDSLINNKCINYNDIMNNFLKWYKEGEYTPDGKAFDIGNATSSALLKYKNDNTSFICGSDDIYSNGNGSLMRILPISIYLHYTDDPMFDVISNISSMTHAHIYSILSCSIYTVFINEYLKVLDIKKAYSNMQQIIKSILADDNNKVLGDLDDLKQKFNRIIYNDISILNEGDIKSSGFVIDSLEASIWCLLNTNNYKDAVLKAVNLGDDTDTIGALTGGLSGLVYGYNNIPEDWIKVLRQKEYLTNLVDKFNELISDQKNKEAIYMWKNGLGDMNKYLNGENPLPKKDKKANADSWKCTPFSNCKRVDCNIVLTQSEFEILSMGHIPEAMEDHWFMYCDEKSLNYFRSWTGIQIFKGYYKLENNSYIIYALEINDNKDEYNEIDINKSLKLFNDLIVSECKTYQ